jgi:DNA-binding SARP family transcriptional activator
MGDVLEVDFRVLGSLEVFAAGRPVLLGGPKPRAVLAALLVEANHVVSADRLIDVAWGDAPPERALSTLQKYVHQLRSAIDPDRVKRGDRVLVTRPPGYVLQTRSEEIDAARFERLLGEAQRYAAATDFAAATTRFDKALDLWRGAAWAEFADQDFARVEATRLEGLRAQAIEDRAEVALAAGRHAELIADLEAAVARYPLRERPRAQLMLALYRCGRHTEALRAYQEFRLFLADEVGLEPSVALQELERSIVTQDAKLDWTSAATGLAADDVSNGRPRRVSELPSGTVTFLFSDIEGSTRLFRGLGHRFVGVLERHRELLRSVVTDRGGLEVNSDRDGLFFAFAGAGTAVAAAAAALRLMQEERWQAAAPGVRMGLHTGDAVPHGGYYLAAAVQQAARVRDAAHGGQILVSQATAAAAAELQDGCSLRDLGSFALKDFDVPVELY